MDPTLIIIIAVVIVAVLILIWLGRGWVDLYNKFQYWINKAERSFADIDVIMQERLDKLYALAQIVKKYDIHEYKVLKETIEARSRWSKDMDLNEKVRVASQVEKNFFKLEAVFERYPRLRADALHHRLISKGSQTEVKLRKRRLFYNKVAQNYNMRLCQFPRNIVGWIHGFKSMNYLTFNEQETYKPKELFDE